jgi:hypothetical protein
LACPCLYHDRRRPRKPIYGCHAQARQAQIWLGVAAGIYREIEEAGLPAFDRQTANWPAFQSIAAAASVEKPLDLDFLLNGSGRFMSVNFGQVHRTIGQPGSRRRQ